MWPNPQETEDFLKKSLMENLIFCAVILDVWLGCECTSDILNIIG